MENQESDEDLGPGSEKVNKDKSSITLPRNKEKKKEGREQERSRSRSRSKEYKEREFIDYKRYKKSKSPCRSSSNSSPEREHFRERDRDRDRDREFEVWKREREWERKREREREKERERNRETDTKINKKVSGVVNYEDDPRIKQQEIIIKLANVNYRNDKSDLNKLILLQAEVVLNCIRKLIDAEEKSIDVMSNNSDNLILFEAKVCLAEAKMHLSEQRLQYAELAIPEKVDMIAKATETASRAYQLAYNVYETTMNQYLETIRASSNRVIPSNLPSAIPNNNNYSNPQIIPTNINSSMYQYSGSMGSMLNTMGVGNMSSISPNLQVPFINPSNPQISMLNPQVPIYNSNIQVPIQNNAPYVPESHLNHQLAITQSQQTVVNSLVSPLLQSAPLFKNSNPPPSESKPPSMLNNPNDRHEQSSSRSTQNDHNYKDSYSLNRNDEHHSSRSCTKSISPSNHPSSSSSKKEVASPKFQSVPLAFPPETSSMEEYNKLPSNSHKVPSLYPPTTTIVNDKKMVISELNVPLNNPEDLVIISLPLTTNPFETPKILQLPTKILCLMSIIDIAEITNHNEYNDVKRDITNQCSRYGKVISVIIPKPNGDFNVPGLGIAFIEFYSVEQAKKAKKALEGRRFGREQIVTCFYPEKHYANKAIFSIPKK